MVTAVEISKTQNNLGGKDVFCDTLPLSQISLAWVVSDTSRHTHTDKAKEK